MALNKRTIHDIFRSSKIIGEGSFGQARLYTDRANNTFVIKKCREEVDRDDEMESVWKLQEIEKLNQHPHLNLGGVRSIGRKFIVMPYHGVTLEDWINQCIDEDEETLGYTTCVRLASQLFRTIHDLSSGGFLHGDIRADNVCSKDGRHWVLIDFGLTEKLRPAKQACGPLPYARCFTGPSGLRAPESKDGYDSILTVQTEVFHAAMVVWYALNLMDFSLESLRHLRDDGLLGADCPTIPARRASLPVQKTRETWENFERRVKRYAQQYYASFHAPFFEHYLKGSNIWDEDDPFVLLLRQCLSEDPFARPPCPQIAKVLAHLQSEHSVEAAQTDSV